MNNFYLHDSPQYATISSLIKTDNDVFVYGLPGIGKSTIVYQALSNQKVPFIKLNCIGLTEKSALMRLLSYRLKKEFNTKIKECMKIHTLMSELGSIFEEKEENQLEKLYIVLDNFEKLSDLSAKFLSSLMKAKEKAEIQLYFIFICSSVNDTIQEILYQKEFCLIPKINIKKPSNFALKSILIDFVLQSKQLGLDQAEPKSIDSFVTDLVYSFQSCVVEIKHFKTLIIWLCQIFIEYKKDITFAKITSEGVYKFSKKYLLMNPFDRFNIEELKAAYDRSFVKGTIVELECVPNKQELDVSKIQSIILISCYFGNRNPEKTDKRLFKDYKKKSKLKKSVKKDEDKKLKPLKYHRFIALVQALMSITLEEFRETLMFHHSMDFSAEVNSLVESGYITKILPPNNAFNKTRYVCNIDGERIRSLCSDLDLRYKDYLHEDE